MQITDTQIQALLTEALTCNDYEQKAICHLALGHSTAPTAALINDGWDQDEARAECARVIQEAAAQS